MISKKQSQGSMKNFKNYFFIFLFVGLSGFFISKLNHRIDLASKLRMVPNQQKETIIETGEAPSAPSLTHIQMKNKEELETVSKKLSIEDQKRWDLIQQHLSMSNDNDQKVDVELSQLSEPLREKIKEAYSSLPMENRNGRGFLAFLVARDLKSTKDLEFLKGIYEEGTCLSLSDCNAEAPSDPHLDSINNTSLNYPQMVTLYQLRKKIEDNPKILEEPGVKESLMGLLREARQFPAAGISSRAEAIEEIISKY